MFCLAIRSVMRHKKLLTASPETTVGQAAKLMAKRKMSAVMVVDADGRLIGITLLAEVMTPEPKTVAPVETFGYALLMMHEHGFRHMPVVEDGKPVGMVSARNALDPDLEEFAAEAERRKHIRRYAA